MYKHLNGAYKKPSTAKEAIYYKCVCIAVENGGISWGIISYNSQVFTFGFTTETGERYKITKSSYPNPIKIR